MWMLMGPSLLIIHRFLDINPLNAEVNPICHLLALLGAHPILHISRIKVKCLLITWIAWMLPALVVVE